MNKIVERAYNLNELQRENGGWNGFINWDCGKLPDLEVGDICTIADVWDGKNEEPEDSYSYYVTESGEDGESSYDISINYEWKIIQENENFLDTVIRITEIELL